MFRFLTLIFIVLIASSCEEQFCAKGLDESGQAPPHGFEKTCFRSSYGVSVRHGNYREWYPETGKVKITGQYKDGKKDGEWQCFTISDETIDQKWNMGKLEKGEECTHKLLYTRTMSTREKAADKSDK